MGRRGETEYCAIWGNNSQIPNNYIPGISQGVQLLDIQILTLNWLHFEAQCESIPIKYKLFEKYLVFPYTFKPVCWFVQTHKPLTAHQSSFQTWNVDH